MKHLLVLALLCLSQILTACDNFDDGRTPKIVNEEVENGMKDKAANIKEKAAQERKAFSAKVKKEMEEVNLQMEAFSQKVEKTSGEVKQKLAQELQALKQERNEVERKIVEMKSETIEKWQGLKAGVSDAINDLKQSINDAKGDDA